MDIASLLRDNWEIVTGIIILLFFLLFIIFISFEKESVEKEKHDRGFLICPIRGILRAKKYDVSGNYTEEYQRIRLIKYLLAKKGYSKNQFVIEYAIPIGHKGHNALRVDLVIRKDNNFLVVVEVKKCYTEENRKSAIKHQLIPAMRILNSKHGIYFDGTKKSRLLVRNSDGSLSMREFL